MPQKEDDMGYVENGIIRCSHVDTSCYSRTYIPRGGKYLLLMTEVGLCDECFIGKGDHLGIASCLVTPVLQ